MHRESQRLWKTPPLPPEQAEVPGLSKLGQQADQCDKKHTQGLELVRPRVNARPSAR